jgi:hypothetical protein
MISTICILGGLSSICLGVAAMLNTLEVQRLKRRLDAAYHRISDIEKELAGL